MIELLVGADDRTGALETAGACADAGAGPVLVSPALSRLTDPTAVVVIDLGSRHLEPASAARRALALDAADAHRRAHKIDSTLRGQWAHEIVARAGEGRALVVPAFPAVGRTCVGGVVLDRGRPVGDGPAGRDPWSPVRSSRPAEHLVTAGAPSVVELRGPADVRTWLAAQHAGVAVCDAVTDADLLAIGELVAPAGDVLFGGTSASIAAVITGRAAGSLPVPPVVPPVLVVCGSLHPMARDQVAELRARGVVVGDHAPVVAEALAAGRAAVLMSAVPASSATSDDASEVAGALGTECRRLLDDVGVGTLVVIGGDTASAVLGDAPVLVGGTVAPGVPWCRRGHGDGPLVLTRAGGFGSACSLVELMSGTLG